MKRAQDRRCIHHFTIRVWQEECGREPAEWRIRIHHINSGNISFSTDLACVSERLKAVLGSVDKGGED